MISQIKPDHKETTVDVIGLGAGGHCRVMLDVLSFDSRYNIRALIDSDKTLAGQEIAGKIVHGDDSTIPSWVDSGVECCFIGVGGVGDCSRRAALYGNAKKNSLTVIKVIHPSAILAPSAALSEGVTILAGAIINNGARLGENVLVNTGAIVEHDCVIGRHSHIAPCAVLASSVRVGSRSHIGLGAIVRQGVSVGDNVIVGAGAVVVSDVRNGETVVGVPARPVN